MSLYTLLVFSQSLLMNLSVMITLLFLCFQVRARNSKYESSNSNLVRLSFDDTSNVDRLTGLHVTHIGTDSIRIEWTAIKGVEGYVIQPNMPYPYPKMESSRTTQTNFQLEKLVLGVNINIKVHIVSVIDDICNPLDVFQLKLPI